MCAVIKLRVMRRSKPQPSVLFHPNGLSDTYAGERFLDRLRGCRRLHTASRHMSRRTSRTEKLGKDVGAPELAQGDPK
jgi:hypothetical protein